MRLKDAPNLPVLVVEDEDAVAATLFDLLDEAGYEVIGPFRDVPQSVEACRARMPAVAVLDIVLERGTSYALADFLILQGIPVVFYTGREFAEIPEWYRQHPVVAKLAPPGALLAAVVRLAG